MNTAIRYAEKGWHLVELHGVVDPEVCTCWKGKDCGTPGKHPVEKAWQTMATCDEDVIASWFEKDRPVNIGLLLGKKSGVIDVELDSGEAKAAWNDLDLGEVYTPTYTSGRGPHRLFLWEEGLPAASVRKPRGIEIRIGNEGGIQSVLPPSRHHTGGMYQWVPGLSIDDVPVAPLPPKLKALLMSEEAGSQTFRPSARSLMSRKVQEGERNTELHRFAVREAFRSLSIDDPQEQQDLLTKIRVVNNLSIVPPLSDNEVTNIYRSVIGHVRKTRAAGISVEQAVEFTPDSAGQEKPMRSWVQAFTESGLSYAPMHEGWDSEWLPGEWMLTVVHSDPLEYRLHVPAWCKHTANGTGNVSLTVDQYRSAAKVAAAVLSATGTIMLDDEPGKWKQIWDGGETIAEGRHEKSGKPLGTHKSRGMKAKLLDNVAQEWPGLSSLRYVQLAAWLYDRLSQASQPTEDDTPDSTGRPCWRKDGTLWFSWSKVWEDIERNHRVQEGDRLSTKRRLLGHIGGDARDFKHADYRHPGGNRKSYVVWTQEEFAVLESLATEAVI